MIWLTFDSFNTISIIYFIQIWLTLSFSELLPIDPYITTILNNCPGTYKQRQSFYEHRICRVCSELKISNFWLKFKESYYRESSCLWIMRKGPNNIFQGMQRVFFTFIKALVKEIILIIRVTRPYNIKH